MERLALAAQAAILLLAQSPLAPVFCRSRLGAMGFTYGAAPGLTDARAVIERAMPKCSAPGQGDA